MIMEKTSNLTERFLKYRSQKKKLKRKEIFNDRDVDKVAKILCPTIDEIEEELYMLRGAK